MKLFNRCVDLLDGACKVLSEKVVDDVHLCAHTSELIQRIAVDVKKTLIRVQKQPNTSGTNSRDQSVGPNQYHNLGENGQGGHRPLDRALLNLANPNQHDSLPEVQARPMSEWITTSQTFIPPPDYNFLTHEFDLTEIGSADEHSVRSDNPADWVAMPLDALMNSGDMNVDQGFHSIGPMVGSRDMLELITNQDYTALPADFDINAMGWGNSTGQFQGFNSPHL
jgi:hypothetical protein